MTSAISLAFQLNHDVLLISMYNWNARGERREKEVVFGERR
ncbi:hypothetical protein HanPI659440_Chr10g0377351 [Helianthus annuus]|nr:hypothetical protein HanPI659440_Chr10g0377351 [Helianthus annuus]